jgi:Raf kinase inhibitor-like YbhB/YbcL family protein
MMRTIYRLLCCILFLLNGMICPAVSPVSAGDRGETVEMSLSSPAFPDGGLIPRRYSRYGENVNPPLDIHNLPAAARSLALVFEDPDAPRGTWVHWVVYDIPLTENIAAGSIPGHQGTNDFREVRYDGPSPPSGTHRYVFTAYALDRILNLAEGVTRQQLEAAMRGHILARARLVGLYRSERR